MKKIVLILTIWLAICSSASAQNSLSLIVDGFLPVNVYYNNTYDIYAHLKNNDSTATFQDTVDFSVSNLQGIIPQVNSIFSKPAYSGKVITLGPQESVPAYFRITIDPAVFRTKGQDVVIIWPMIKNNTSGFTVMDSLIWNVVVDYPLGMEEQLSSANDFILKNQQLYFPENGFGQVRIFSTDGKIVYATEGKTTENQMAIHNWSAGLYIIRWTDADNRLRQTKLIKNE